MADWSYGEYRSKTADKRLLMPLEMYLIDIDYLPFRLSVDARFAVANVVTSAVRKSLSVLGVANLIALSHQVDTDEASETYFSLQYSSPVYGFGLTLNATGITIFKPKTSMEDLFLTLPVLRSLVESLFPVDQGGQPVAAGLFALKDFADGIYRRSVRFSLHLAVQSLRSSPDTEANNLNVMQRLFRFEPDVGGATDIIDKMQPDQMRRMDSTIGFNKVIGERLRQLWFTVEAPWNITQRDLDIMMTIREGEGGTELRLADLHDLETAMTAFYQELCLNRFLLDLLHDLNVEARLG